MSTQEHKQLISGLVDEVWNQHDAAAIDRYFGPGLREEVAEHYQQLLGGFPDLQVTAEPLPAPVPMRTVVSGSSGCTSLAVYSPNASPLSRTRTCWPTARPILASRAASTEQCSRRSCRSRW